MREFWSTIVGGRGTAKERPSYRTVLDLGTEQIKALVLELAEGEGLVVGIGRASCQQGWGEDGNGLDVQSMARSCDQALRQAEDMAAEICGKPVVPDWVVVGLPSYLTVAQAFTVTHHRSEPEKRIRDRELRQVVERAQRLALQQLARDIEAIQDPREVRVELLEAAVADIRVDGHTVTNPAGFRGKDLTVAVFNVVVASPHLRAIEAVTTDLGLEILTTVSGWQPLASMLDGREGICMDVGGKTTDIVLVRNGKAWATASLPLGGSDFTKHLAGTFGLSWKDAESLKLAYSHGIIDGPSEGQVSEAISQVMNAWLVEVEATLRRLSASVPLPHDFNLCGGGCDLPGMIEVIRSHPWMQALKFSRHPQVRFMEPQKVSHLLDRTGQLRGQQAVAPLALAGYTMARDAETNSLDRLLWRVKKPAIFGSTGGRA